jgi:Na+-transporting NADH:ubiquinone oxidoreductase subunit B
MKFLQKQFDKIAPLFEKGGKYEKFHTIYEGHRTIFFAPAITTGKTGTQIKDATDLKRVMMTVIIAMIPCLLFGMWNVGHQHYIATGMEDATFLMKFLLGAQLTIPIIVVSYAVGLGIEFTFCVIRNHPVEEGYLVTGMLIPLVMPPGIPLWQVALATAFAVIIGKEVFGVEKQ